MGGEISAWAQHWFWRELSLEGEETIRREWAEAQTLELSFLPDEGDRAVTRVAYAVKSWHSRVLTLDKKTFWAHRERLADLGVVVQLPSELWEELGPQL